MTTKTLRLKDLSKKDLAAVVEIEKLNSYLPSPITGVWTIADFKEVLSRSKNIGYVVVNDENKIVAFVIFTVYKKRLHICNMVVHPAYVRTGIGTQIMGMLKNKMIDLQKKSIEIDIRESNLNAQLFLRYNGFKAVGIHRNWFEFPEKEDAYKFQYSE